MHELLDLSCSQNLHGLQYSAVLRCLAFPNPLYLPRNRLDLLPQTACDQKVWYPVTLHCRVSAVVDAHSLQFLLPSCRADWSPKSHQYFLTQQAPD